MRDIAPTPDIADWLRRYEANGGVLDYIFLDAEDTNQPSEVLHRTAALVAIAAIDRQLEQWAIAQASAQFPLEQFFRLHWDAAKLTGEAIAWSTFWGSDAAELQPLGNNAWQVPNVDGYKTAFFLPPYNLRGTPAENAAIFAGINAGIFGANPEQLEIFAWSTDWSNYFEAGLEWWGAFFWTLRQPGSRRWVVIGASATD